MAMHTLMTIASGTPEDIIRVTGHVREEQYRALINKPWVEMFPAHTAARHAVKTELRGDVLFQAEIVAVLQIRGDSPHPSGGGTTT